ncbi:TRAP transporter small permease subunit [Aromatoleum evansii]|uniref:TRAP transporter small permease protein n=1 Tax=Aromatoleum evansii TaxID=59406 RepID=A0ABZ1ARC7_AROEV|nr:TRAP transporter small permease subunit [Aromatoleum evansii]
MHFLIRCLERLALGMNRLAAVAAVLMSLFVFLGVVMRYFVGAPFAFSDEFIGLLFATMAFLAMPLGLVMRRHIILDIVTRGLQGPLRHFVDIGATVILTTFCVWFLALSYDFADFSRLLDARSDIGSMLLWPWMAMLPLCTVVMVLVSLGQLFDSLRQLAGRPSLFSLAGEEEVL